MESIIFVIEKNMTNKYIKRLLGIDSYISKSSGSAERNCDCARIRGGCEGDLLPTDVLKGARIKYACDGGLKLLVCPDQGRAMRRTFTDWF